METNKMNNVIISILISIILISCKNEVNFCGYYTPISYKNNFDTLHLQKDGIFTRKVYDKDEKLLLDMQGNWSNRNDKLKLTPFYLNLDDDLKRFPHLVKDTTGEVLTFFEYRDGSIEFCVGYYVGQNCYKKIE